MSEENNSRLKENHRNKPKNVEIHKQKGRSRKIRDVVSAKENIETLFDQDHGEALADLLDSLDDEQDELAELSDSLEEELGILEDGTDHPDEIIGRRTGFAKGNQASMYENRSFVQLLGQNILLSLQADQLNILGQTFRPVFCGKLVLVTDGYIQLNPVIIKFPNAPFHRNPFPLNFPINRITFFVPFDCETRIPLT